jgi:hypothetical protein
MFTHLFFFFVAFSSFLSQQFRRPSICQNAGKHQDTDVASVFLPFLRGARSGAHLCSWLMQLPEVWSVDGLRRVSNFGVIRTGADVGGDEKDKKHKGQTLRRNIEITYLV